MKFAVCVLWRRQKDSNLRSTIKADASLAGKRFKPDSPIPPFNWCARGGLNSRLLAYGIWLKICTPTYLNNQIEASGECSTNWATGTERGSTIINHLNFFVVSFLGEILEHPPWLEQGTEDYKSTIFPTKLWVHFSTLYKYYNIIFIKSQVS